MTAPMNTFHIAFDTQAMPGFVVVTTVRLTEEIVPGGPGFDQRTFSIGLREHPLYPVLADYVANNPPLRPAA